MGGGRLECDMKIGETVGVEDRCARIQLINAFRNKLNIAADMRNKPACIQVQPGTRKFTPDFRERVISNNQA